MSADKYAIYDKAGRVTQLVEARPAAGVKSTLIKLPVRVVLEQLESRILSLETTVQAQSREIERLSGKKLDKM